MTTDLKKKLRIKFKCERDQFPKTHKIHVQSMISQTILDLVQTQNIKHLGLYHAIGSELDIFSELQGTKPCLIYLPKLLTDKGSMDLFLVSANTELIPNQYHIMEPEEEKDPLPHKKTMICVPSLAVDRNGIRLGYGGGYYDRYLASHPDILKVGIQFEQLFIKEALPREPHDICLDALITEQNLYAFKPGLSFD